MTDMTFCENGIHEKGRCYKAGGDIWCGWEYYHKNDAENEKKRIEIMKKYIPIKKNK